MPRGAQVHFSRLHAGAFGDGEWLSHLLRKIGLQLIYSFVLIDGIKVFCLTVMSGPYLESVLPPRSSWPITHKCIRKPVRRLHKVLDVLL